LFSGPGWGAQFLPKVSPTAAVRATILFLDTYLDNLTNLSAAKPGFLLVKLLEETARPCPEQLVPVHPGIGNFEDKA